MNLRMQMARGAVAGMLLSAWAAFAAGQSVGLPTPRLLTLMPMGAKAGTTIELTINGEYLEDVSALLFSDARLTAKPKTDASGQPVNNHFLVTIPADCPVGLYEARVLTRLGLSTPRIFAVGTLNEVMQTKPNQSLATAQELPLNSVCNGATSERAIDFYKFTARQGQRLVIDCAAPGIDSKLLATVILADSTGRDLLVERRGQVIDFLPPKDDYYVIKLHELTFKGGPAFFYRLGLWEQQPGTAIVRQPSTQPVHAFSWPPPGLPPQPSQHETEPNNDDAHVQRITLPCDLAGAFYPAADVDMFEFSAKKGEEWWIEVASERLGCRTDPALVVQRLIKGEKGAPDQLTDVLELSDIPSPVKVSSNGYAYDGPPYNAGTSDLMGKLPIKEEGLYRLQLRDRFGGTRSIPGNQYRLVIRRAQPDFALVAWALHMELRNGDRNALSKPMTLRGGATMALEVVAFRRDGFVGDIDLVMEGLPTGVTAQGLKIPSGQSRGLMLITAQPNAPRGHANAAFFGRATIGGATVTRPCRLASVTWPIPDAWNEIPAPRLLADVPVSVSGREAAPLAIRPKAKHCEALAGQKLNIPLLIDHTCEPSGSSISVRVIGPGFEKAPKLDLPLKASDAQAILDLGALKIPPGEYHVSFLGGGVVKYRHRPELVAAAEAASQQELLAVQTLEAEVKKASSEVTNAPPAKKEQMSQALAAMHTKMKAANDALKMTRQKLTQAKDAAQPREIVDIVVSEPITIHVKPAEKK